MEPYQNQYENSPIRQAQEYGSQGRPTDEYGNPIYQTSGATGGTHGGGGYGTTGTGVGGMGHGYGGDQLQEHRHGGVGGGGVLRRSGSSSSSSSEDDGEGGRRKKGLKDKVKEKIPGRGHKDDQPQFYTSSTGATAGYGAEMGQQQEKKGMMDKIKEKLPGHH